MSEELIQVWLYDENKKFVGTDEVFELGGNMTTTPLVFAMNNPTYDEKLDTWFDKKEENKIDKMKVLEGKVNELEMINGGLLLDQAQQNILINEQDVKLREQETINANLLLEVALLKQMNGGGLDVV